MTSQDHTILQLSGLPGALRLCPQSAPIAHKLRTVLNGWPVVPTSPVAPEQGIFLDIARAGDGFRVHRLDDGWASVEPNEISAICTAVVELIDGYAAASGTLGLLHAGSAVFAGRVVLFPAGTRAGKSTLMTRLACAGHRVLSDDLIPLDMSSGEAVTTGALPRPRLPLPRTITPEFAAFVADSLALSDGYYGYVDPGEDVRPRFGQRAPVGAVVLLERSEDAVAARLEPAPLDAAMWALLSQDTRKDLPAQEMIDRYLELISHLPRYRLVYSDLEDAVTCLEVQFSRWSELDPPTEPVPPRPAPDAAVLVSRPGLRHDGFSIRQAGHVSLRDMGQSAFLIDERSQDIHALDPLGVALWHLMAQPVSTDALVSIVAEAFPDVPAARIADDIASLIEGLHEAGLVERVNPS